MANNTSFRATDWVLVTPSTDTIEGIESIYVTVAGSVTMESLNGNILALDLDIGPHPFQPRAITAAAATVYALF